MTIELVPLGVEALSRTIAEVCIDTAYTEEQKTYTAGGYKIKTDNKIEDFAIQVQDFDSRDVVHMIGVILSEPQRETELVRLADTLINKTRLLSTGEESTNE